MLGYVRSRRVTVAVLLLVVACCCCHMQPVACRSALYNTNATRKEGMLNVHIISHTHNDPGWLSSFTQYHRTVTLDDHTIGGVEAILDSVVLQLLDNPDRTFVYADLAFFVKWWQELHEDTKATVRHLVQQGRFEFTGGGIVQHDEATSHYSGMIDQMSLGMRFLQEEFGHSPKIAWQLDGFGHSNTEPLLKSMGGFEAVFFGRSDHADMAQRKQNRSLELIWRGSEAYGSETDMFASQYPTGNYGPPSMQWFFERRDDYGKFLADSVQDDPETGTYNVQGLVDEFVQRAEEWQRAVQGDDVYFFMGGDFTHSDARMWFNNVDKMIHYGNKDGRVNAFYSTPSRYLAAKRATAGLQLPLRSDDFFPYSSNEEGTDYWTGYFTSRPTLKAQIRRGWSLLRATHQLEVLAQLQPGSRQLATTRGRRYVDAVEASEPLRLAHTLAPHHDPAVLEFALATSLHHDAITGTQKLAVTCDYEHWIHTGITKAAPKLLQGLQHLLYPNAGVSAMALHPPSSSSSSSSASYAEAAVVAAAKMRIGAIFRRRLAQKEPERTDLDAAAAAAAATAAAAAAAPTASATNEEGVQQAEALASSAADDSSSNGSSNTTTNQLPLLSMCLNLNSSLCSSSVTLSKSNNGFLLVVYNPLSWSYTWGVRLPVEAGSFAVAGPDGQPVLSQLLPLPDGVQLVWPASKAAAEASAVPTAELAMMVSAPPLGHAVYKVVRQADQLDTSSADEAAGDNSRAEQGRAQQHSSAASELIPLTADGRADKMQQLTLSNGKLQLKVGPAGISSVRAGNLSSMQFNAELITYSNDDGRHAESGAYIFTADGAPDAREPYEVTIVEGPVVLEVRQRFLDVPGALTTRLWAGKTHLEVEWTVGLPPDQGSDWEVFVRYNSDVKSQGLWFTDANGREYQRRRRQYRPSFTLPEGSALLAGNIYPITTGCFQQDEASAMHVAVDRAQGVVSLADGQMDVHLHRASRADDGKGMNEPLIDDNAASGTHIVSFGLAKGGGDAASQLPTRRHYEQVLNDPLQLAFSAVPDPSSMQYQPTSSGLAAADSLPPNVHILTSKWLSCSTVLLRLSHMFQAGEHPDLSQQTCVKLSAVARLLRLEVKNVQEATLFGERPLNDNDERRPVYNISRSLTTWQPPLALPAANLSFTSNRLVGSIPLDTCVTLNPMQIRAFFLTVRRSHGSTCKDPPHSSKPIAAGGLPSAAATAAGEAAGDSGGLLLQVEQMSGKAAGAAADQAAALEPLSVQQMRTVTGSLLGKRINPSEAKAAHLSRGALLLLLLVPAGVTLGIARGMVGRRSTPRSRSVSPKYVKVSAI